MARQQLYRERYLYNGQTLIPMIKPLQAMVTVHDAEGNTLAVSPTKYANKTDEELIGLYQVGRK
jgi:hypothetical protein